MKGKDKIIMKGNKAINNKIENNKEKCNKN